MNPCNTHVVLKGVKYYCEQGHQGHPGTCIGSKSESLFLAEQRWALKKAPVDMKQYGLQVEHEGVTHLVLVHAEDVDEAYEAASCIVADKYSGCVVSTGSIFEVLA